MHAGLRAGVQFEEACGGNAECCTCLVDAPVPQILENEAKDGGSANGYEEPEEKELDALDFAQGVKEHSRLACQMKVCRGLEGLEFLFEND
mmetsp:Transcript_15600/g.26361  ORF Transcript_15600/g.26361 Transcript_15600/m.26361 type:complete len:91 (-) Transcript_15600:20-292(-)